MKKKEKNTETTPRRNEIPRGKLLRLFLHGSKRFFIISILTSLLVASTELINPQLIRYTVDTILADKPSAFPDLVNRLIDAIGGVPVLRLHLWIPAAAIAVIALLTALFRYLQRVFNSKAAETLTQRMRNLLFTHIQKLPFAWHMKNQTGDIIQRCTSDVDTVKNFLSEQLTAIWQIVLQVVLSLTVMYTMSVPLALAATLTLPVILVYSALFGRKIGERFQTCDEAEGVLSSAAQENLTGVRVVRAFGRESYERDRFAKLNDRYTELWLKLSRLLSAFWSFGDLITGIQIMLILTLGTALTVRGQMTPGAFIAFIAYNERLTWPIRRLGRVISEMSKADISLDRLEHILAEPPEADSPDASEPPLTGDIAYEDVSFGYEGCPELIHHVSFTVKAGSTVGILGGTGSGKSTLMYLLDRLYELPDDGSGGRITIGGVNIASIRRSHLRRQIGIVLQEPYLFSRSLADNIGIARKEITLPEIREAASVACFDETVMNFADGYDTFVGERGVTLSGGQKQRAAIARMLTEKTPILIFDDSLSAVDAETDAKIRSALKDNLGGATVFLISHRTATLMKADKILILDRGQLVEQGTHAELMAIENGIYRRIYELQRSDPDAPYGGKPEEVTA